MVYRALIEALHSDSFFLGDDKSECFEVCQDTATKVQNVAGKGKDAGETSGEAWSQSLSQYSYSSAQSPEKPMYKGGEDDPATPLVKNGKRKAKRAVVDSDEEELDEEESPKVGRSTRNEDEEDNLRLIDLTVAEKEAKPQNGKLKMPQISSSGWIKIPPKTSRDVLKQSRKSKKKEKKSKGKGTSSRGSRKWVIDSDEEDSEVEEVKEDAEEEIVVSDNDTDSSGPGDDVFEEEEEEEENRFVANILNRCATLSAKMRSLLDLREADGDARTNATSLDPSKVSTTLVSQEDIFGLSPSLRLKSYQLVGVNWLLTLHRQGVSGVLADEMGLGKTVQTIAFLALLNTMEMKSGERKGPHLVVVPASVLTNWKLEIQKFCPVLRVEVYHGLQKERYEIQDRIRSDEDFDILLTTYSYFERDACKDDRSWLRRFSFGYMVLDEGHSVKNSKSSRFTRLMAVNSSHRLLLSGTPVQNALSELLSILTFIMPSIFDCGSEKFQEWFNSAADQAERLQQIKTILAPFVLRRLKAEVLDQLPGKNVRVEMISMDSQQQELYTAILKREAEKRKERGKTAPTAGKGENQREENGDKEPVRRKRQRTGILRELASLQDGLSTNRKVKSKSQEPSANEVKHLFTELRKASNHPLLLRTRYVDPETLKSMAEALQARGAFGNSCTVAMVLREIEGYSDFQLHSLCVEYRLTQWQLPKEALLRSCKLDFLKGYLPTLQKQGRRVLLFSQWTKLLDLLEIFMGHMQFQYLRLDGQTAVSERQDLIDKFTKDKDIFIFLLSTRAGGLGLNLTAADTVILHDLDFNPHNDRQAEDRCHRIGQTRDVTVIKLVTIGTVDEDILRVGERKKELDEALLGEGEDDTATMETMIARAISSLNPNS